MRLRTGTEVERARDPERKAPWGWGGGMFSINKQDSRRFWDQKGVNIKTGIYRVVGSGCGVWEVAAAEAGH